MATVNIHFIQIKQFGQVLEGTAYFSFPWYPLEQFDWAWRIHFQGDSYIAGWQVSAGCHLGA